MRHGSPRLPPWSRSAGNRFQDRKEPDFGPLALKMAPFPAMCFSVAPTAPYIQTAFFGLSPDSPDGRWQGSRRPAMQRATNICSFELVSPNRHILNLIRKQSCFRHTSSVRSGS